MDKTNSFSKQNPVAEVVAKAVAIDPAVQVTASANFNETAARDFLSRKSWPLGLQDIFIDNLSKIPMRFFICDDSGSMEANDGHKLVLNRSKHSLVPCSRWAELTEALKFHAAISREARAVSEFRLLNGAPPIRIGTGDPEESHRFSLLNNLFDANPGGGTPLCKHIREVTEVIRGMEHELRAKNQKACIIIATDGESSDGDIAAVLRPLRLLPAWVVIRLCTDEDRIVNYWNNVDNELELDMDVLDDLCGEAKEVYEANPWLTYGEPLHRLREFGIPVKEIDLLDEVLLSPDQIRLFCSIIFGGSEDDYPHPQLDWHQFSLALNQKIRGSASIWDPITNRPQPWLNIRRIKKSVTKGGCTIQ